ncbi:MAG TPA: hypothetical protein VNG89_24615, partial [Vicinamibacterales bacterium]|nr:hypothetical protein [Vicinamibacterales bacterium]
AGYFQAMRRLTGLVASIGTMSFVLAAGVSPAADALYEIKKTEPKVAVGATATASLTITAKAGWHVNDEAPITVALTAPAGVTLPKAKLTRADLAQSTKETARFDIPVSATEAGKKTINAEARFVLCQEQACKPVKETLALAVDVAPAVAEAPKALKKSPKKK